MCLTNETPHDELPDENRFLELVAKLTVHYRRQTDQAFESERVASERTRLVLEVRNKQERSGGNTSVPLHFAYRDGEKYATDALRSLYPPISSSSEYVPVGKHSEVFRSALRTLSSARMTLHERVQTAQTAWELSLRTRFVYTDHRLALLRRMAEIESHDRDEESLVARTPQGKHIRQEVSSAASFLFGDLRH